MTKKIVLVNGSPRKNGLTNALITQFKTKIEDLNQSGDKSVDCDILQLSNFTIEHCNGCDSCLKKPNICPLSEKDDMPKIEEILKNADAIIVGAPSYFANIPGIMKDLIDRSRAMKMARYQLQNKYFSTMVATGLKDGGGNWVVDTLIHWALIQGMIVVGALGHPVLANNIPSESLQMQGLKEFRKPSESGEIANLVSSNLAERVWNLLI
ncbi:MAG: flavodoxin family protein [archaeon]|nr:flavodoxin family protein [archaeon]